MKFIVEKGVENTMIKWKNVLLISALAVSMVALTGCGKEEAELTEETTEEKEVVVIDEPEEEELEEEVVIEEEANMNLLTGLNTLTDEAIGKRPVAIMFNNVTAALPQYGIEEADVVFEIPVEGDLTRLMAIYGDYTQVPLVCSVRSCRYYFPAISEGFDAFYVSWGMDTTVEDYINSLDLSYFNGSYNTAGLFDRDDERLSSGYATEHTGTFDGTGLVEAVESEGMRSDLEEDKTGAAFSFNEIGTVVTPTGDDCTYVEIDFGAQESQFEYDEENDVYLKFHNGSEQLDGNSGEQLSFTNVFVLETTITTRDDAGHKDIDWEGGEDAVGYYISNGVVQEIRWSKSDEESYLVFYTLDGEELSINRGTSYIALNYADQAEYQ